MKKHHIFLIFTLLLITAQSCGVSTTYVKVDPISKSFEAPGTQHQLYVKANNWMVETFNNSKSVIQFSDKEAGMVTGKYLLHESYVSTGAYTTRDASIYAVIKLQVKDGASKITIIPDDYTTYLGALANPALVYTEEQMRAQIDGLINSYETYLKTDTSTDW